MFGSNGVTPNKVDLDLTCYYGLWLPILTAKKGKYNMKVQSSIAIPLIDLSQIKYQWSILLTNLMFNI